MSSRRLAREYALQTLYYSEAGKISNNEAVMFVNSFFENLDEQHFSFCKDIVLGVNKNKKEIDILKIGRLKGCQAWIKQF